jgi:hypothetical protein
MASTASHEFAPLKAAHMIDSLVRVDGSGAHSYPADQEAFRGKHNARNIADVIHHICLLHGRHPGVIDHAGSHITEPGARGWLVQSIEGFSVERSVLAKLVVACGPIPSTPGQAETESTVINQRHALDMLAQSDRRGCALGAAAALVIDWWSIRPVIEMAAKRFSVDVPECSLPTVAATLDTVTETAETPAIERAVTFGAQQLLSQHRGLWDLLEARTIARGEY